MKLTLADNLKLPLDFVTQTQAILAMRRRGKTYTASVMAEELLAAKQQIVVIDITGAWWGLKSSANGKSPGFEIVVAGGEHADIPLDPSAGRLLAEAITTDRFSAILDLKLLRKSQRMQFLADFLETFAAANRSAVHLFADEADDYCPQTILWKEPASSKCLGAMDDLVRRGGINGIGATLITQRPAVLNNNVLTQCQLLTLLRLTHPADLKPVREWVKVHATKAEEEAAMARLPMLGLGQAIFWSPGWPEEKPIGIKEVQIRERATFNSSRTPKAGERVTLPKRLAKLDLKRLGARIQELAAKAKAEDPKALKQRIAELEREKSKPAAATKAPPAKAIDEKAFERAVARAIASRDAEWHKWRKQLEKGIFKFAADVHDATKKIRDVESSTLVTLATGGFPINPAELTDLSAGPPNNDGNNKPIQTPQPAAKLPKAEGCHGSLTPTQQRILNTVATLNLRGIEPDRDCVARWQAMHPNGGRYGQDLGALRAGGYLEGFVLTELGAAAAKVQETGPDAVVAALPDEPKQTIFQTILGSPTPFTRDTLAETLGIHPNGGRYGQNLGWLRTMQVITARGDIKVTEAAKR